MIVMGLAFAFMGEKQPLPGAVVVSERALGGGKP